MSALIIGTIEQHNIEAAKKRAMKRPVPLEVMRGGRLGGTQPLTLRDREQIPAKTQASEQVLIPFGYRAMFSYEEQPGGLTSHLSIGVEGRTKKGMMPSPEAVQMIAQAFGVPFPPNAGMWTEEYEPGEYAINLVSYVQPPQEGNA